MSKKITCLALVTMLFALCFSAEAQQPTKVWRLGYVTSGGAPSSIEPLRQRLQDLGYIEGKNIVIEFRSAEAKTDRVPGLVAELVQLKVDVLVLPGLTAIHAAKQATKTIPIVMVANFDPVETGIVDSLARPGGNITGISTLQRELSGKRLELLKEAVPKMSRVGVLWDPSTPGPVISFKEYETVARAFKIALQSLEVRGPNPDFEGAFRAAAKGRASALITISNALVSRYTKRVTDLAIKNRLPSMYETDDWVDAGGLMSYAADDAEKYKRAAYYVDRILKGTKPADLPVEQPMKFELVINLKTAKQIGVTIPQWTLMKADRVIR
jgi:putative ABC transport system substrate-binding protein